MVLGVDYIPFQIVIAWCSVDVALRFVPCSDEDFAAQHAIEGSSEGWEKSVTPVDREWRVEKCSRHAFFQLLNCSLRMSRALS